MQSLANFHGLTLKPASPTIKTNILTDQFEQLKALINNLPAGGYVVRGLLPRDNIKKEAYGHTMTFIKYKDFAIFFDNAVGAEITEDLGEFILTRMISYDYKLPEFRIYSAKPPKNGCRNISKELSI